MINRLGPTREEALRLLMIARDVCDEDNEPYADSPIKVAQACVRLELDFANAILRLAAVSDDDWTNGYTARVCRFLIGVLQWVHDKERRLELEILGFVVPTLIVKVDPKTRAPLAQEWPYIAGELPRFLKYEVEADRCVMLRHFVLTFGIESGKFVVTEKESSK